MSARTAARAAFKASKAAALEDKVEGQFEEGFIPREVLESIDADTQKITDALDKVRTSEGKLTKGQLEMREQIQKNITKLVDKADQLDLTAIQEDAFDVKVKNLSNDLFNQEIQVRFLLQAYRDMALFLQTAQLQPNTGGN
ncbi:MAG: hypothetical protein IIB03_07625, partial [Acidobacteria bacterium]|nr:hypothetical protein [Acidobacteriota bacterium]